MQAVAALSELAIPHFTTATIFSVAQGGSDVKFYANVKLLAVGHVIRMPFPGHLHAPPEPEAQCEITFSCAGAFGHVRPVCRAQGVLYQPAEH